jgi:hypothetical protein
VTPFTATTDRAPDGQAPEYEVVGDLLRHALPVAPVIVAVAAAFAGIDGALSAAVGVALVAGNLLLAAASLVWAGRISLALLMGVALGGYAVRIGLLFLVVWLLQDLSWVHLPSLGLTLVVTHLGLLVWELRYVSASLAHPGLKPATAPVTLASKERRP